MRRVEKIWHGSLPGWHRASSAGPSCGVPHDAPESSLRQQPVFVPRSCDPCRHHPLFDFLYSIPRQHMHDPGFIESYAVERFAEECLLGKPITVPPLVGHTGNCLVYQRASSLRDNLRTAKSMPSHTGRTSSEAIAISRIPANEAFHGGPPVEPFTPGVPERMRTGLLFGTNWMNVPALI